jgi:hypothetical protein
LRGQLRIWEFDPAPHSLFALQLEENRQFPITKRLDFRFVNGSSSWFRMAACVALWMRDVIERDEPGLVALQGWIVR